MDDSQLLQEYVKTGSQKAFAVLVERHIDLVYAAARRQVRDADAAEEITQSVFIVLARKAATLYGGQVLPGWLLATTRYAVHNARTRDNRRQIHEQRAAVMKSLSHKPPVDTDEVATPWLDEALSKLNEKDRSAVAMRYFQGKSARDIAAAMGVSEAAAHKRVLRAVEKLRAFFRQRGISMESAALMGVLAKQSMPGAPPALSARIASGVFSAAATGASSGLIAEGVLASLQWLQPKLAAIVVASLLIVGVAGGVIATSQRSSAKATSQPVHANLAWTLHATDIWMPYVPNDSPAISTTAIDNASLIPALSNAPEYFAGIDSQVMRTTQQAAVVTSLGNSPKGAGVLMTNVSAELYRGKRIRYSAYLKSRDVERAGMLSLQIFCPDDNLFAHDEMDGHEVVGTHDWQRFDIVSDVPENATAISMRMIVAGKGDLWGDGFELAVVDKSVPMHDDHGWRSSGTAPGKYTTTLDQTERRQGRPTIRLAGAGAQVSDWIAYAHTDHDPTSYAGKHVRFSAMLKSEGVIGRAGPFIRAVGKNDGALKMDIQSGRRPLSGSMGWMSYTTEMDVPEQSLGVCVGILLPGRGTVWLDDVRLEVVENR